MGMNDDIKQALKVDSKFHNDLLLHVRRRVEVSRNFISKYYCQWDHNDEIIRGQRIVDEKDKKAALRGEPTKMVLPFAYAQVNTFIAFFSMLFNQRSVFYEFEDNGSGDYTPEGDAEKILDKDLTKNAFSQVQYQCFLDLARCGFCVVKSMWEETTKKKTVRTQSQLTSDAFGGPPTYNTTEEEQTVYVKQGNRVITVSPWKFFPDTRLPLSRMNEGEFCASEDVYSIVRLKQMEANGMIVNSDKVKDFTLDAGPGTNRRLQEQIYDEDKGSIRVLTPGSEGSGMGVVTEVEIWISPKEFQQENGNSPLGNEDAPQLFVVQYANDKIILKAEPLNYPHGGFCYDVGEFSSDQIRVINESLAQIIDPLQDVATWFLNSRITSVRKNIDNKFVVDPLGIEVQDLIDRSPIIRLKPGVARSGVNTWIQQLKVEDVTTNHVNDVTTLWSFIQITTGINDNSLGQYNGGRRSATESRTVNSGAASRLKTIANVLWEKMFVPLGMKLTANLTSHLDIEMFKKYIGPTNPGEPSIEDRFAAFQAQADFYSFEFFDGTAPSEKGFIAQSMQDLLLGLMTNPLAGQMLTQEPFRSMVVEIADLRGIRSPERFLPPKQTAPLMDVADPHLSKNGQPQFTPPTRAGASTS